MIQTKLSFRLHKSVIIITCIALIALLMQSVSYISRIHYQARIDQFKQLSHTLAEQVAFSLSDYIVDGSKDFNREVIIANLDKMTSIVGSSMPVFILIMGLLSLNQGKTFQSNRV